MIVRTHSTGEGGEPQGSRKGRPRDLLEGRGEQAHESAERRHAQDAEPARVMLTDIDRVATLAKEDPARKFYSIAHLITEERLRQAFWNLRKDASPGIDGVTHAQYAAHVEENIRSFTGGSRRVNIRRNRYGACMFQRKTGSRDPSRSRFWRTNSCRQWLWTC